MLFLDESTSGLDSMSARTVKSMILNLRAQGNSVCFTTDDMATVDELCYRVAFIVDGTLISWNSRVELRIARSQKV